MSASGSSTLGRLYERPVLLLTLTMLMWAGNAIAGQLARGEITPVQHVAMRWGFITAILWPLYGGRVLASFEAVRPKLGRVAAMALLGFTAFNILYYIASANTTAVNVGILQGSVPMWVFLLAFALHRTPVTPLQVAGVLIALVGVTVVATRGAPWLVFGIAFNFGDVVMLIACASYAGYAVLLQGRPAIPGSVFFTLMAPIAFVTSLPPLIWESLVRAPAWPTAEGWLITFVVALFPGIVAQQFFMRGVDLIGPGRAGVFTNLVPVFAAVLAVALLGETFAWFHGLALALVLGGIALVQLAGRS